MRIICRSSDVFSSDLLLALRKGAADDQVLDVLGIDAGARQQAAHHLRRHLVGPQLHHLALVGEVERRADVAGDHNVLLHHQRPFVSSRRGRSPSCLWRSEEHTSELQSLMRISYAVFCLKKKKNKTQQYNIKSPHKSNRFDII